MTVLPSMVQRWICWACAPVASSATNMSDLFNWTPCVKAGIVIQSLVRKVKKLCAWASLAAGRFCSRAMA
jgi:hypothetical protein